MDSDFEKFIVALAVLEVDGPFKQRLLALVYVLDKVNDAALVAEAVVTFLLAAEVGKS